MYYVTPQAKYRIWAGNKWIMYLLEKQPLCHRRVRPQRDLSMREVAPRLDASGRQHSKFTWGSALTVSKFTWGSALTVLKFTCPKVLQVCPCGFKVHPMFRIRVPSLFESTPAALSSQNAICTSPFLWWPFLGISCNIYALCNEQWQ